MSSKWCPIVDWSLNLFFSFFSKIAARSYLWLFSVSNKRAKTLFCENAHVLHRFGRLSTRILKTQRLKMHFFETGSQGGEIRKRSTRVFMWTANPHTFQNDDAIAPPLDLLPLTSEPRDVSQQQQQQWRTTCLLVLQRILSLWTTPFSVVISGSMWMQIFLKRWRGGQRKKRSFSPVWTGP